MSDRESNAELTWPDNCSAVHAQLDSTASCSVCNDFYDVPLVLPCGHSFCSNCIRSYISHQQGQARCPQCRAACDERDLRPNTALRDLVDKLLQTRPAYIAALRNYKAGHSRLVKASEVSQSKGAAESQSFPDNNSNKRQLRSGKALNDSPPAPAAAAVASVTDRTEDRDMQESPCKRQRTAGSDSIPNGSNIPSASAKVNSAASADVAACPICNRTFKAGRVLEAHVNRCIDNPPAVSQEPPVAQQHQPQKPPKKPQKGVPQVKVPAKIAFHLFNDKKLRDKLKDINLPISGKRKELEDRYNRLRLEVQLAADKGEAASEAELVRRAMAKEKTLPVKGFFGAAAKGVKWSGCGTDAASDDPDAPEVEYESFAALIQATKERDAARRAKQQKAQLADPQPPASDSGPDLDAAPSLCDKAANGQSVHLISAGHKPADGRQADGQHASGQPSEVSCEGQITVLDEKQHTDYPAGLQSCDEQPSHVSLPNRSMPPGSGIAKQRSASQDPGHRPAAAKQAQAGMHSTQLQAERARSEPARQPFRQQGLQLDDGHQVSDDRVDLTLDDVSDQLSQESLHLDVDDPSAVPDHGAQDQRALQQLQLPNKSAESVIPNGKGVLSSHAKGASASSTVAYQPNLVQKTYEECLGVLDGIIEDTDSDVEGMAA